MFQKLNTPTLYVITALFNPKGYKSRYVLYKQFEKRMLSTANVVLCTVECLMPEQDPKVKKMAKNHIVIQVDSLDQLWLKENLINIGFSKIPDDAEYVCWIDADIEFKNQNWVEETIGALQTYDAVQMFSKVIYLDNTQVPLVEHDSLMYGWLNGATINSNGKSFYRQGVELNKKLSPSYGWHGAPGGAWAYRKSVYESIGGLFELGVVGSGDSYSAFALIGIFCPSLSSNHFKYNDNYLSKVYSYVNQVYDKVKGNVGYLDGEIIHYYHGKSVNRNYWNRNAILCDNDFDPDFDTYKNKDGVIQLTTSNSKFIQDISDYFQNRKEDEDFIDSYYIEDESLIKKLIKRFNIFKN